MIFMEQECLISLFNKKVIIIIKKNNQNLIKMDKVKHKELNWIIYNGINKKNIIEWWIIPNSLLNIMIGCKVIIMYVENL